VRVALHFDPNRFAELVGIWVAPEGADGYPERFYPSGTPESLLARAEAWMEVKPADEAWPRFFEYLAGRLPYSVAWSYLDVDATYDLEALFVKVAADVVGSAVAREERRPNAGESRW
jgi:hypothetical protein